MYDKDGSGTIELNEMIEVMTALQCMDGASKDAAALRGRRIFEELDINDDGEISCEEFVRGCMMDPDLVRTITAGGLDPLEEECDWEQLSIQIHSFQARNNVIERLLYCQQFDLCLVRERLFK